ncbi:uncharacterized protein [Lolium perenne]|uniref:uncharacterized protein n=1 Tax=Lolium perenne TaxID=4522 RepID=UPI0021F5A230|nr:uncharacterized protein LOC127305679 [Lolium perenne]
MKKLMKMMMNQHKLIWGHLNMILGSEFIEELIKCCAQETTKRVIEELDGGQFAILADESSDVYQNEQLVVCLRFVYKKGRAVVRFLGVVHVEDTTSLTLKSAIQQMLMKYNLTFAMVRGQGYDGASNMKGNANGLKKLIMDESPSAYYVHCFAHQLQLTLVAVAKESGDCTWFFQQLANLLNVLGMSCKKMRMLRIAQAEELIAALDLEEVEIGTGQNQEMGLGRPCDTRWGSHFRTMNRVLSNYAAIKRVLRKIVTVTSFCTKHRVKVVDMNARYYPVGRPRRVGIHNGANNYHRFHVDMYVSVIDRQISELNGRFDEVNTELLTCMAAFCPLRAFAAYDKKKLVNLASKFYATDFSSDELARLPWQLDMYICHVRRDGRFTNLKSIIELSAMLVETTKHQQYFLVYKLLKLVLILPVATASVERVFSSMNYVKNKLRNKMSDEYLNNALVTFVERDFFSQVKDEDVIKIFQQGDRRVTW